MISAKLTRYLADRFRCDPEKMNFKTVFQDYRDAELKEPIRKAKNIWDLIEILIEENCDKEIEAHLLGYESDEHRQAEIKKTEEMIARIYEY